MNHVRRSLIRRIVDAAPSGSVHLGLGEIRLPLHPLLRQAAERALAAADLFYTPNAGLPQLRSAIAARYGLDAEGVCVTVGAAEGLYAALTAYIGPGDRVLLPTPAYPAYETIICMAGGMCEPFPLLPDDAFRLDTDVLAQRLPGAKALVLCNPSNPLSTRLDSVAVQRLAALCEQHGVLLLADEIYRDLWLHSVGESFIAHGGNVLVVGGLSKSHALTGWRLGWVVGTPELVAPVIDAHQYICTCAPALSQRVALFALSEEGRAVGEEIRRRLALNMDMLLEGLRGLPLEPLPPDASPYVWCRALIPNAHARLLEAGVITIPGDAFGMAGDWLRISCGVPEADLREGLRRMAHFFEKKVKT